MFILMHHRRLLFNRLFFMLLALCILVLLLSPPAFAQSPAVTPSSFSFGDIAGQLLLYVASAFAVSVGSVLTIWIKRMMTKAGIEVTQQMSDQLDKTLVNGLNDAAAKGADLLKGQGNVPIKNAIIASAVQYAQAHRAETIQALGLDPQSGAAVAVLKARIATLAADPNVPTPAVLDPPKAPVPAQAPAQV